MSGVACLLCQAVHTESAVGHDDYSWRCERCGQRWDNARIATVLSYQQWAKAVDSAARAAAA